MITLRMNELDEILAAVPACLRYVPRRSLVVLVFTDAAEGPSSWIGTVRIDLPADPVDNAALTRQLCAHVQRACAGEARFLMSIVIDGAGTPEA